MSQILLEILGEHYDSINSKIKEGKHEGTLVPKLHDNFDTWVYIKSESRLQIKKNIFQANNGISQLKDALNKLYQEARKYAEPRELNCLSHIECFDFSESQGAHVLRGNQECNFISFYGFQLGN